MRLKRFFLTLIALGMALTLWAQLPAASDGATDSINTDGQETVAAVDSSNAFLTALSQSIEANPILRFSLLAFLLLVILLVSSLGIFLLLFVLNFRGVSQWFNRKAGMCIIPQSRFDKLLWRFVPFYATIVIGAVLISEVGGVAVGVLAVAMPIICWRYMVGQRAAFWGSRRIARWEMIYIVYAGFAIFMGAILLWWALICYLLFKLVKTFVTAPSRYTCGECSFYEGHRDGSQNGYCRCHHKFVVADHSKCSDFS